jgi:ABC-type nitrate/sulfonate/bicarbonate transport system substrate-binding protein
MIPLSIALDWTFNANHLGFIIAKELGFYNEASLDVTLITPNQDNNAVTPAKKVELGQVDFALCPLESVISYQTKSTPFALIAIATLFKEDLSAIACKAKIAQRPADLNGKSYASYKARYEDSIVRQMLRNDGATGDLNIVYPDKLGIWNTIENDSVDSTWIFLNWEALEAEMKHMDLALFQMKDYDIPYSYSPVIVANQEHIFNHTEAYKLFLKATQKGWEYAQKDIKKAVAILKKYAPENTLLDFEKSVALTNTAVGSINKWGIMDPANVTQFLKWLQDQKLESDQLAASDLYTNTLLS